MLPNLIEDKIMKVTITLEINDDFLSSINDRFVERYNDYSDDDDPILDIREKIEDSLEIMIQDTNFNELIRDDLTRDSLIERLIELCVRYQETSPS
jgi:hypothetical protein